MIYVDALFVKELADSRGQQLGALFGHKWCHLWCDVGDEERLHALAERMGIFRWAYVEAKDCPHYLLTPVKREQALRFGVRHRSFIEWIGERRREIEKQTPSLFPDLS